MKYRRFDDKTFRRQTFRRQTIYQQTFRRHIMDVSPTNMCECWIAKMTVNPEEMLALIAEETDAGP